jgi:HEAT repeat protein
VRHAAAAALKRIEAAEQQRLAPATRFDEKLNAALNVLVAVLGHSNRDLRQAAVEALGRVGDSQTIPRLVPVLQDGDKWVRQSVQEALQKLGWQPEKTASAA